MATTVAPAALVVGAPRQPLPFGLFSAFSIRPEGDGRWQNGVQWETGICEPPDGIGQPYCPPDATVGVPKNLDRTVQPVGIASAFLVYGHYACSALSNSFDAAQRFATDNLKERAEARVEQALWFGDLGNVPNFSGANGYDDADDLGSFATYEDGLGAVEQYIAENYGSLGVIHMSRATATSLAKFLESRGGRLYTRALQTPVVAGAGYPDNEIVGTPALFGYRGEVFTSSDRAGDLMNRANNDMVAVAEQTYLVGFDPCGIVHVGITPGEVTPPAPLTDLTNLTVVPNVTEEGDSVIVTATGDGAPATPVHLFASTDNGTTWIDEGEMS